MRHYPNIALSYGSSPSKNTGRYYAAWEDKDNLHHTNGHIYTSHSDPGITGSFTTPFCLDCGDPTIDGKCSNPSIATQYNTVDNDSANISSVILFQHLISANQYDIGGFYNLKSATTNSFHKIDVAATSHNELQPNVTFNHFDNNFNMTYYDSTAQKMPCLSKDFNFNNPNSWTTVSPGYNDSTNIKAPYPKVIVNEDQHKTAYVWNAERSTGNGIAMFDAEYSTWTGISNNNESDVAKLLGVYPNPCNTSATIGFELMQAENVTITLCNVYGQALKVNTNQFFTAGKHHVILDAGRLVSGTYIYTFTAGELKSCGKVVVIH